MAALPRQDELSEKSTPLSAMADIPEGFEVVGEKGLTHRVKLRRTLHHGAPLGITIITHGEEPGSTIHQYDVSPSLDMVSRTVAQSSLVEVFLQLRTTESIKSAKEKLEGLAARGICVGCRFTALSSKK